MSDGSPCVAHLVCPIPQCPSNFDSLLLILLTKSPKCPFDFSTTILLFSKTAIPAES